MFPTLYNLTFLLSYRNDSVCLRRALVSPEARDVHLAGILSGPGTAQPSGVSLADSACPALSPGSRYRVTGSHTWRPFLSFESGQQVWEAFPCLLFAGPTHPSPWWKFLEVCVLQVSSSTACRGQQLLIPLGCGEAISIPGVGVKEGERSD